MANFDERLKELREEKRLTQRELSIKTNITERTISRWENGGSIPDIEHVKILCAFFGCTSDYIIGIKDDE